MNTPLMHPMFSDGKHSVSEFPFAFQGKQISQITAFIWRWFDEVLLSDKGLLYDDKGLKEILESPTEDKSLNKAAAACILLMEYFLVGVRDYSESSLKLRCLFAANPRKWINEKRPEKFLCIQEVRLLECIFGEDRIMDPSVYLSPTFTPMELGFLRPEPEDVVLKESGFTKYEFVLDPNTFNGHVSDPFVSESHMYRYFIPFPPRPTFEAATVTKDDLEEWVANDDNKQAFPKNLYIPVST